MREAGELGNSYQVFVHITSILFTKKFRIYIIGRSRVKESSNRGWEKQESRETAGAGPKRAVAGVGAAGEQGNSYQVFVHITSILFTQKLGFT